MVATQVFYTFSFCGMLIALLFILMFMLCINDYYRVSVLRWLAIDLFVSGKLAKSIQMTYVCQTMNSNENLCRRGGCHCRDCVWCQW